VRVEPIKVEALTIFEAHALDPITVILQDAGPNNGRLIIECYGDSWTAYWGAMGEPSLRAFLGIVSTDYIANRMMPGGLRKNRRSSYLLRIVAAVKEALAQPSTVTEKP